MNLRSDDLETLEDLAGRLEEAVSALRYDDALGHEWEWSEPTPSMQCALCGRKWLPHQTAKQIGRCPKEHPLFGQSGLGSPL